MSPRSLVPAILAVLLAALVFGAGFLHDGSRAESKPSPAASRPGRSPAAWRPESEAIHGGRAYAAKLGADSADGLLALTGGAGYKRAADFSLRVADCTRCEDDLEARLEAFRGEILEMVMEGTEGSRTCTISVLIPSDRFREFVVELRKMGKVQSERITATRLKPGAPAVAGDPDARELALVSIRMADERVAKDVLESRGLLAASFDRSASHFMKGLAVVVEYLGYALPFLLILAAVALPFAVAARWRRARALRG